MIGLALQLLAATPAAAPRAEAPSAVHATVAADVGTTLLLTPGVSPSAVTFGVSEHLTFGMGFEAALGLRVLVSDWFAAGAALEGYGRIGLAPAFGRWHPALSIELGLTAAHHLSFTRFLVAPGNDLRFRADYGPMYLAFSAVPLRFAISSFAFSLGALAVGTDLFFPGRILRVQISAVELSWRFR